jgi:hypothetical protein
MSTVCPKCGKTLAESEVFCTSCGTPAPVAPQACSVQAEKPACACGSFGCGLSIAALSLASVLFLLCLITAFVDSSTFINRLYTTALAWNLPLVAVLMIVFSFALNCKRGACNLLNWIATGVIILAFFLSNVTKNTVQDVVSNADNFVGVASEALSDEAENISDWAEDLEDAAEDAEDEIRESRRGYYY